MGDEIKKEEAEQFSVPEINTSLQAITMIWQAMEFLLTNYKKTVVVVLMVIVFIAIQIFTNFTGFQKLLSLVGM